MRMEWTRGTFKVTDDLARFDMSFVVESLQSMWRKGASKGSIESAFVNSLCFGLFDGYKQIGYVRAVTDREFVSWVSDLFVAPAYRGKGLGRWLMDCVMKHPELVHTRLVFSSAPEAQAFYERLGFKPMERGYSMTPRSEDDLSAGHADEFRR